MLEKPGNEQPSIPYGVPQSTTGQPSLGSRLLVIIIGIIVGFFFLLIAYQWYALSQAIGGAQITSPQGTWPLR